MTHKYFTYFDGVKWGQHLLLPLTTIEQLYWSLVHLAELHCSVQSFDENGENTSCPIYADFDGATAFEDMERFSLALQTAGIIHKVYYSGRRGYHVIGTNYRVTHPKCHLIVKYIINKLGNFPSLDEQIYGNKHMMRMAGSKHLGGTRKLKLDYPAYIKADLNEGWLNSIRDEAAKLVEIKPVYIKRKYKSLWKEELPPCIYTTLTEMPPEGQRNMALTILARYMNSRSVALDEALDTVLGYSHWDDYNIAHKGCITGVFNSIFNSGVPSGVGCKGVGADCQYLRSMCNHACLKDNSLEDL